MGSIVSGSIEDVYLESDATNLVLSETVGTPGFTYDFRFGESDPVPFASVVLNIEGYYDGTSAHTIKLQQWNFNTSSWDNITTATKDIEDAVAEQTYKFYLIDDPNYLSSGELRVRINHSSAGNPVHELNLDKFYLSFTPPSALETIFIVNRGKPGKWIGLNNYLEL